MYCIVVVGAIDVTVVVVLWLLCSPLRVCLCGPQRAIGDDGSEHGRVYAHYYESQGRSAAVWCVLVLLVQLRRLLRRLCEVVVKMERFTRAVVSDDAYCCCCCCCL